MEMNKAKNLIIHEKEIMSRPKRTYMAEKPNTGEGVVKPGSYVASTLLPFHISTI